MKDSLTTSSEGKTKTQVTELGMKNKTETRFGYNYVKHQSSKYTMHISHVQQHKQCDFLI